MKYFIPLSLILLASCSTPSLNQEAGQVLLVQAEQANNSCQNLGPVVGKGEGVFGGAWISDQNLLKYAVNDIRNNGANMDVTHVVIGSPQMGQTTTKNGGTTSTATYAGIAYKCS